VSDFIGGLFAKGGFGDTNFPDLFYPITFLALALFIGSIVLYNVQARRLHRHPPLVNLQEWLLWTGICTFGLVLIEAVFHFYFAFLLVTVIVGCITFWWIRFRRFPPIIAGYNQQLRRARFYSAQKYKHPEATVRTRTSSSRKRRRR
jgi:hypothetical protein